MKKIIVVTGGAGCIGMPVCKELLNRGVEVVLYDLYEQINAVKNNIADNTEIFYGSILDESRENIIGSVEGVIFPKLYIGALEPVDSNTFIDASIGLWSGPNGSIILKRVITFFL